ncbi:MAG: WG repeat-containing protein [Candidatus Thiodiazotropha sp.]
MIPPGFNIQRGLIVGCHKAPIKTIFAILLLGGALTTEANESLSLHALPVPIDNVVHWALLDADNRVVVAPESLLRIGGLADMGGGRQRINAQAANGKWGYLDEQGHWLVEPELDEARGFVTDVGLARARQGNQWGYIKSDGSWLVKPRYESARPFYHGFAAVAEHKGGDYFFIDTTGKKAFDGEFSAVGDFGYNNLAPVARGEQWGYVDQTGKMVIQPQFDRAFPFSSQGVAQVTAKPKSSPGLLDRLMGSSQGDDDEALSGVIDTQGRWIVKPKFEFLWAYNDEGLAWGQWQTSGGEKNGYVDTQGKLVWEASYHDFHAQMNGLMCAHGMHYQFFTPRGEVVIAEHSQWADSFRDPQVTVALRDQWGLLYRDGRFEPFESDFREPLVGHEQIVIGFSGGLLAGVTRDRNVAYFDRDGKRQLTLAPGADGRLTLSNAAGKPLWRGDKPSVPVRAVLNPGPEEHFTDLGDWQGGIVALAEKLIAAPPRAFYPDIFFAEPEDFYQFEIADVYDRYESLDQLPSGAYKVLAYAYQDEGFLGYYGYLWEGYPNFGKVYFPALRKQLTQRFGEPITDIGTYDHVLLGGDWMERAIWRLHNRYLILESMGQVGDGEQDQALILAAVEAPFIEGRDDSDSSAPVAVPQGSETPPISETSDPRVKELVHQAAQAVYPAPRDARRFIAEALALVEQGAQISEYDYLWTQYGLLKSSDDTDTSNFANSTPEAYRDTALRVLGFLDEHGLSSAVFMPGVAEENEFKGEVYRTAANGLAWLIYEADDSSSDELESALAWAVVAEQHIRNEEDYYILDTKVRILLRLGRTDAAYRIVSKVLQEDPEFGDFEDFIDDDEYQAWRRTRG